MNKAESIPLSDSLQRKWFEEAMTILRRDRAILSQYDYDLYRKLADGYDLAGSELTVTRKQMNHIKQVAAELLGGRYG